MAKVVIEVRGGCVAEVYSDDSTLDVSVIDWDELDDYGTETPETSAGFAWGDPAPIHSMPDDTKAHYEQLA